MSDLFGLFYFESDFFVFVVRLRNKLRNKYDTWYKSSPYNDPVSFVFNAMLNLARS